MLTTTLLKENSPYKPQYAAMENGESKKKRERKKIIICRSCDNPITWESNRTTINGKHQHSFSNPSGYIFEIGCFDQAAGCINEGIPTTEFTWFQGFGWCYSLCSKCLIHLGWLFSSGSEKFFGLIINRLREMGNEME